MIKNIIFDLDGTLANSEELIINSFQHIYLKFKGSNRSEEYIKSTFGATLKDVIKTEFSENPEIVLQEYRNYHHENFEKYMKLFNGAKEIIEYLYNNNYYLGIVTSRLEYTTLKILEMYNIKKYFSSIITADMCVYHKPHSEPLLKCLAELHGIKDESIFIGDTIYDIECAKNSGVKSILVSWNNQQNNGFTINPDYIISNYEEIRKIILY